MEGPYEASSNGEAEICNLQCVRYSPFQSRTKFSSSWFDLRVFYVRISNFQVDNLTPSFLLSTTSLGMCSDGISSLLRRDRIDKKSEEATFVSTDSIRTTGSVKLEVYEKDRLILSGVLQMSNNNGSNGEFKGNEKRWSMTCESAITVSPSPTIEVYITGCFSGMPIILTKIMQLSLGKKHDRKGVLDAIPGNETTEFLKNDSSGDDLKVAEYKSYKLETEEDDGNMYWRRKENLESEDGELSWFKIGVRVGVGIGLGICVGIGVEFGLLIRTYQATNFKRRLV
ncbi:hypothetical protein K2173_027846 [Erythroxylum novogranatense]|uniref:Erythronate-4-phosphate dehydrogenase family protein n=1 Tax=Erythroxylum novogranatense TaxID=1862640 RepID=A0AAV8U336_9ROSI|nr:hypothetical protein K2173_027846 [Erythroxylum novogranatense]